MINENEKISVNHNFTNNKNNNNKFNIDNIDINSNAIDKNEMNNNTFNNNEFSTISQKDYNYYNEESLKLSIIIKKY